MVDTPRNKLKGLDNLPASGGGIKYILPEKKGSTAFTHTQKF